MKTRLEVAVHLIFPNTPICGKQGATYQVAPHFPKHVDLWKMRRHLSSGASFSQTRRSVENEAPLIQVCEKL